MLLYIDPGTGSMIFTVLLGVVSTLYYLFKKLIVKIRFVLSAGRIHKTDITTIPYLIFSDSKNYWNVFKPVCDEFEKRKIPLVYWTASNNDEALTHKYDFVKTEYIGEGNRAFAKLNNMRADVVLATTPGLDVLQWKRSKNVKYYVHILHAAGTSAGGYRMFSLDYYDAVLLTGEYQIQEIRELETKRRLPSKEIEIVGCTYMDLLKEKLDNSSKEKHDILTVLLAPSWGQSSLLVRYGNRIIDCLIDTGYKIIIRPHPQSFKSDKEIINKLMTKYSGNAMISWDTEADNFKSLNESDIMISDFSSVMFDYALVFDKPFIYTESTFDKAPYEAAWLDEELWKFKVLPSIGIPLKEEQFERMKEVIKEALSNNELKKGIEKARKDAWANIGNSAKMTADFLVRKHKEIVTRE